MFKSKLKNAVLTKYTGLVRHCMYPSYADPATYDKGGQQLKTLEKTISLKLMSLPV